MTRPAGTDARSLIVIRDQIVRQSGVSLMAVVIMMLIMAVMGSVLLSMVGTENTSTIGQMRGDQAFYVAEGGIEFGERYMTQNFNWYVSPTFGDPYTIPGGTQQLGPGTFTATVTLPATALTARVNTIFATTICVNSVQRFPNPARILIEDEILTNCAPTTGAGPCGGQPRFTGCSRGQLGTVAATHRPPGFPVYPVAQLNKAGGLVPADTVIPIDNTLKFLAAGTVQIGLPGGAYEQARYNGIDLVGNRLLAVVRGVNGTAVPANWPNGTVVTPLQDNNVGPNFPDFQVLITSTGTVSNGFASNATRMIQAVAEQ